MEKMNTEVDTYVELCNERNVEPGTEIWITPAELGFCDTLAY